jgi:hypothetical protein
LGRHINDVARVLREDFGQNVALQWFLHKVVKAQPLAVAPQVEIESKISSGL